MQIKDASSTLASAPMFTKIFIWFSVLGVLLLSASSIWTFYNLNQMIQASQERREVALGKGLALAVSDLLVTRNYGQIESDLRQIMSNEAIHNVATTDINGVVLAFVERQADSNVMLMNYSIKTLTPPVDLSTEFVTQKQGERSVLWYRIDPGVPLGWIRLESYIDLDDGLLDSLRRNIMLSTVILFMSLFGVSIALFYRAKKKTQTTENTLLKRNEILHDAAHLDALTNLPNRLSLNSLMHDAMLSSREGDYLLAVCFLDLDGFKEVNDRFSHQVGDKLLIAAARRVKKVIRERDEVIRLAGDEFVLLLGGISLEETLDTSIERILQSISAPFMIDGDNVTVSASIGVSIFPTDGTAANELVAHADTAMYQAKRNGKNCWVRFQN
jgi:diguanylate cyclase (GGDEF)-like protein